MNTTATTGRLAEMSPKVKARLAGGLLLITMLGAGSPRDSSAEV